MIAAVISIITIIVVLVLAMIAIAVWRHDKRLKDFRINLEAGQTVIFFRAYYSRTEDVTIYTRAIIEHIDDGSISLITQDMKRVHAFRHELYPTDY